MQPSNAMLTDLRALAQVPVRRDPLTVVEDYAVAQVAESAYTLGKIDGRVELAKQVLEDLARGE